MSGFPSFPQTCGTCGKQWFLGRTSKQWIGSIYEVRNTLKYKNKLLLHKKTKFDLNLVCYQTWNRCTETFHTSPNLYVLAMEMQ